MAQWVEHLGLKPEDWSLIPRDDIKTGQAWHPTCNHSSWEAETGDTLSRPAHWISWGGKHLFQRDPSSVGKTENNQGRHLTSSSGFHTHIHTCKHTRTRVCTSHTCTCKGSRLGDSVTWKTCLKPKRMGGSTYEAATWKGSLKMSPNSKAKKCPESAGGMEAQHSKASLPRMRQCDYQQDMTENSHEGRKHM